MPIVKWIIFTNNTYNHVITIEYYIKKNNKLLYIVEKYLKIIYNFYGDIMNVDIRRLNSNIDSEVLVNIDYEFSKEEMEGTELISCRCSINGDIYKTITDELAVNFSIKGIMVLPCAITLKPVEYPFNIEIDDEINAFSDNFDKNYKNTIDIFPIIWENILMEIPMRVVSSDAKDYKPQGDGWKLITEEEHSSPFDELKNLFDE